MTYDHDKVLEENTRESIPSELRNLRIFAVSLIALMIIVFIFIDKYAPKTNKLSFTHRLSSQVIDNYDNISEYYMSWL